MILRTLTDSELLRMLDDRIARSPILRELANRLQNKREDTQNVYSEKPQPHLCPVCEADLSEKS